MKENEFLSKLKYAVERAAKKQIEINRNDEDKLRKSKASEANFKALLYHELITEGGLYFGDIKVESPLHDNESNHGNSRFDFAIKNSEERRRYVIEVKMVNQSGSLSAWISNDDEKRDDTVYYDLKKLKKAMSEDGTESCTTQGMMVIAYHGTANTESDELAKVEKGLISGLAALSSRFNENGILVIYYDGRSCTIRKLEEFDEREAS